MPILTHRPPFHKLFLWLLGTLVTVGSGLMCLKLFNCYESDTCHMFYDFVVAYRPAWALVSGKLSAVYDVDAIEHWMNNGTMRGEFSPTLYPPYSLFLFYPLGWLNPVPAAVCWFGVHFLLLASVLYMRSIRTLLADTPLPYVILFFLPFCIRTLLYGQVGMLYTALFLLVIVWRKAHPIRAGIAFSLLCFKPHIALALGILLLVEKNGKALLTCLTCLTCAVIASFLCWGVALWLDYAKVSALSSLIIASALPQYLRMMVSFFMAVRMAGGSVELAQILQSGMTLCVAVTLWLTLKRCTTDSQRLLLIVPATFLLSPYSFIYDTVLLAPLCILLVARVLAGTVPFYIYILLTVLALIPVSAIRLYDAYHFPYVILAIACTYAVAWRQAR